MDKREAVVQKKLMDRLTQEFPNIYIRKIHQTMYSHKGIPDLIFCLNGAFGAIEVKKTSGVPTKLQLRELDAIRHAGGIALICAGVEEIENVISILKQKTICASTPYY